MCKQSWQIVMSCEQVQRLSIFDSFVKASAANFNLLHMLTMGWANIQYTTNTCSWWHHPWCITCTCVWEWELLETSQQHRLCEYGLPTRALHKHLHSVTPSIVHHVYGNEKCRQEVNISASMNVAYLHELGPWIAYCEFRSIGDVCIHIWKQC